MVLLDLNQVAEITGARLSNPLPDTPPPIDHVASLHSAGPGALCFYSHARHREALRHTGASAVLLRETDQADCPVPTLLCDDPYLSMARAMQALYPVVDIRHEIHPSAVVDAEAQLESPVRIGPNCVIAAGVHIGANSILGPNCIIENDVVLGQGCHLHAQISILAASQLGDRVEVWPGTVIGSDGFGYAHENRQWIKLRHQGRVRLGDDCEIGACVSIDRGMLDDTVIGTGVKIDNQVQVAHNVTIGDHSAIAGCAGIAGSATIGKYCQIGGAAGVQGHVELADGVIITGMSKASHTLKEPGAYSSGTPIQDNSAWLRNAARFKQLDKIVRALRSGETHE